MDTVGERELQAFIYHEARLLDERRFDEWLALFTPDGRYWAAAWRSGHDHRKPEH